MPTLPLIAAGDEFSLAILVAFVLVLGICSLFWSLARGNELLDRWARRTGVRIIAREHRWFAKGPYFWRSGRGHLVYRIAVTDAAGVTRRGWARCGGRIFGLLSDRVDVQWDCAPPERFQPPGFPVVFPHEREDNNGQE